MLLFRPLQHAKIKNILMNESKQYSKEICNVLPFQNKDYCEKPLRYTESVCFTKSNFVFFMPIVLITEL